VKYLLFKVVVVASTVGMALPTGWCCTTFGREPAPAAHAKTHCCQRSCCQRRQMKQRADSGSLPPAGPNLRCCCQRDAALPVKRVQQSVAPTIVLPTVICDLSIDLRSTVGWISSDPSLGEGPPINLLQCVWRC
jgi:hypothetical protein